MSEGQATGASRTAAASGDAALLAALRAGDEAAFAELVAAWSPSMLRIARSFVGTWQAAEDVVQDTWLGVVRGLADFEQRSTLRTWVLSILANRARTRATRDRRLVLWSDLAPPEADGDAGSGVDPARFRGPDDPYPGTGRRPASRSRGASSRRPPRSPARRSRCWTPRWRRSRHGSRPSSGCATSTT
jgi:hypothetical protein